MARQVQTALPWGKQEQHPTRSREEVRLKCRKKTGTWAGVRLPTWIPVYDCRVARGREHEAPFKAPWGETLYGGERAQYQEGLKRGWSGGTRSIISVSGGDYRYPAQIKEAVREGVEAAIYYRRVYHWAKAHPAKKGVGGSSHCAPALLSFENYGWGLEGSAMQCATAGFGSPGQPKSKRFF